MIKDKFTPELKKRFLDDLRISKEINKERGFVICIDEKENLVPSQSCEGNVCSINLGDPSKICPTGNAQGDFHTHPYLSEAKKELASMYGETRPIPSDETIINHMKNNIRTIYEKEDIKDITINSPSGDDLLHILLGRCLNRSRGTVCTLSDIGEDKLECWTVKEMDKDKRDIYCAKAYSDIRKRTAEQEAILIEKWVDNIFDREIIDLKK